MSVAPAVAGPSSHDPPFFNDVHSYLQNIMGELSRIRESLDSNEAQHQQNCDRLRKDIEQERLDSRESMNKFRYEFDELVHKRVETVVEGLEDMEQSQKFKDRHQQRQIDTLEQEVNGLESSLAAVNSQWSRFKRNSHNRGRLVEERQRSVATGTARRTSLQQEIDALTKLKAEKDMYETAEQMRIRLKGAAQFARGEEWDRVLREQDKDGSGQISFPEFRAMCRAALRLQEPDASLRVVFDSLDADGSGEISIAELVEFVSDPAERMRTRMKRAVRETGNDWRKLVREHDADNSGQISFIEFRRLCHTKLKLLDKDVQLAAVFHAVDADRSGEVSIRELTAWVEGRKKPEETVGRRRGAQTGDVLG